MFKIPFQFSILLLHNINPASIHSYNIYQYDSPEITKKDYLEMELKQS